MYDHMSMVQMFVQSHAARFKTIQAELDARRVSDSVAIG